MVDLDGVSGCSTRALEMRRRDAPFFLPPPVSQDFIVLLKTPFRRRAGAKGRFQEDGCKGRRTSHPPTLSFAPAQSASASWSLSLISNAHMPAQVLELRRQLAVSRLLFINDFSSRPNAKDPSKAHEAGQHGPSVEKR